jgi:uncharacterized protein (UPF0332 family)
MAKTVAALLSLAREKLSAAEALGRMGFYRDAISRAYYGMYHTAQALLLAHEKKAIGHIGTISAFNHYFVKAGKVSAEYTKWFSALKESREFADYEGLRKFTKRDVDRAVKETEGFLSTVEKLIRERQRI